MSRPCKTQYYLDIATAVAQRSSCLRRKYGSVIVKNDQIISTGFNGNPRGTVNCCDLKICSKNLNKIPHGVGYAEFCESVHAEMNAIIHSSRSDMLDSTLYLSGIDYETGKLLLNVEPCSICYRMIINAGIKEIVVVANAESPNFHEKYKITDIRDLVNEMRLAKIKERE